MNTQISRRALLASLVAGFVPNPFPVGVSAQSEPTVSIDDLLMPTTGISGSYESIVTLARETAQSDFNPPDRNLSGLFSDLDYDAYRAIRSQSKQLQTGNPSITFDPLPPGMVFTDPVNLSIIDGGETFDLRFDHNVFSFDPTRFDEDAVAQARSNPVDETLGYSGCRLRAPLNRPDRLDEFLVFQGGSYFRGVARGMIYGLSARGLSVKTASAEGEEFPSFTHLWMEIPELNSQTVVVRALLDSASCTGAFEFEITPGDTTLMETRCRIFPRQEIDQIGIAPLTSMFFFDSSTRAGVDDFRDAVHDSSGLQMVTGEGRRIWRSLANPETLQVSAFSDHDPQGFGLSQRRRDFKYYQDAEARYEQRPSCWVEPVGSWGPGAVILVEIPVDSEFNDNIVAFWRPQEPLQPSDDGHSFEYRLHWCDTPPDTPPLGRVYAFRSGADVNDPEMRVMVVDFFKEEAWSDGLRGEVRANGAAIEDFAMRHLPDGKTIRVSWTFDARNDPITEFDATLFGPDGPESESWLYRLTS